jgi:hypothetical protein
MASLTAKPRDAAPKRPAVDTNRARADFLLIDAEVALTFAGIALAAKDEEKKRRTTQTARKAYDTILRLRKNADLTDAEGIKLDRSLLRLKSELQRLGETI